MTNPLLSLDSYHAPGLIGLHPANESHRYKVTRSLIGWAQTWNQPCAHTIQSPCGSQETELLAPDAANKL